MDVTAIQERLRAIKDEVGTGNEYVALTVKTDGFSASIYPHGVGRAAVALGADTTAGGAIDKALASYREKRAAADASTTERMALAIIGTTHRHGECSKANLRCDFGGDVDRLGDDAVALANSMSEAGPFDLADDEGRNAA